MSSKMRGRVVEFDSERLFGFIRPDGQIKQVLVRRDALEAAGYVDLVVGERVEFKITLDDRYIPVAVELRRLNCKTCKQSNSNRRFPRKNTT